MSECPSVPQQPTGAEERESTQSVTCEDSESPPAESVPEEPVNPNVKKLVDEEDSPAPEKKKKKRRSSLKKARTVSESDFIGKLAVTYPEPASEDSNFNDAEWHSSPVTVVKRPERIECLTGMLRLRELRHPNIAVLYGVQSGDNEQSYDSISHLILEPVCVSLRDVLLKNTDGLPLRAVVDISVQLVCLIVYLVERGVKTGPFALEDVWLTATGAVKLIHVPTHHSKSAVPPLQIAGDLIVQLAKGICAAPAERLAGVLPSALRDRVGCCFQSSTTDPLALLVSLRELKQHKAYLSTVDWVPSVVFAGIPQSTSSILSSKSEPQMLKPKSKSKIKEMFTLGKSTSRSTPAAVRETPSNRKLQRTHSLDTTVAKVVLSHGELVDAPDQSEEQRPEVDVEAVVSGFRDDMTSDEAAASLELLSSATWTDKNGRQFLLKDGVRECQQLASNHGHCDDVQLHFLSLVQQASSVSHIQRNAVETGCVSYIVPLMQRRITQQALQVRGISAIRALCQFQPELKTVVAEQGGLSVVLGAMGAYEDDAAVQRQGCATLWSCSTECSEAQEYLVVSDGLTLIDGALEKYPNDESLICYAFGALLTMALHSEDNQIAIGNSNVFSHVRHALSSFPANALLQEYACGLLLNLSSNCQKNKERIVEYQCHTQLLDTLKKHAWRVELQDYGISTLANLATHSKLRKVLLQLDAEKVIKRAIQSHSGNEHLQAQGRKALSRLAKS